jgi:hypothetical protein
VSIGGFDMHGNLTGDETRTTNPNASACSELQDCADALWFGRLSHEIWPTKPWLMLMQRAGVKERSAHNYADGTTPPPASVLVALLRSVEGYRILKKLMEPAAPDWWVNVEHAMEIKRAIDGVGK